MSQALLDIVRRHGGGEPVGVCSVCSAHPFVLEAAAGKAARDGTVLLVEATSNQVDQFGGYTGMRPPDFRDLVLGVAQRHGLGRGRVVLGGDHLGPNRWRDLPAEEAMSRAEDLVAAYAGAGFTKIHLDCSVPCAEDPGVLDDEIVSRRAARLAAVAEREAPSAEEIFYVVGTEVPVPGGARETLEEVTPTSPEAARNTLGAHEAAFGARGLGDAWERVVALVVQPGVEFDHTRVVDYDGSATEDLRRVPGGYEDLVFEAHSTDYQTRSALRSLVRDHWAILKVGPALTFAFREALFALAAVEEELVARDDRSCLLAVIERRMLAKPGSWEGYYPGDADEQRLLRRYSYSDRVRYYWSDHEIRDAQDRLIANLAARDIPPPLLGQHLPEQYRRVRRGTLPNRPEPLILDHVRDVLEDYAYACDPNGDPNDEERDG